MLSWRNLEFSAQAPPAVIDSRYKIRAAARLPPKKMILLSMILSIFLTPPRAHKDAATGPARQRAHQAQKMILSSMILSSPGAHRDAATGGRALPNPRRQIRFLKLNA